MAVCEGKRQVEAVRWHLHQTCNGRTCCTHDQKVGESIGKCKTDESKLSAGSAQIVGESWADEHIASMQAAPPYPIHSKTHGSAAPGTAAWPTSRPPARAAGWLAAAAGPWYCLPNG